jgi:NRAMP (natural resistance-associated macrophage protein)-like metal ion transporter
MPWSRHSRRDTRLVARATSRRRHHARRRTLRGRGYFARLGPGFVTGAADNDPSGIGTYSQVGAQFGFRLLWSPIAVAPMAAAVQETAARLGLVTGKGLAALIRERFPRPVLYVALALTLVANTFNIGADVASMASATQLIVAIPTVVLVVTFTALMLGLELSLPYHRYARVLRWLALSLLAYVVTLATVHVDWSKVVGNVFAPHADLGPAEFAALIAVFGTTVSPYLFFWQASEEVEELHDEQTDTALSAEHLTAMRVDVIGGMTSAVAIAFVIMLVSASTLHEAGVTKVATAAQAADALRPLAGDLTGVLFAVGIVGLGLLAVPVLAGSSAYALAEAFGWREGLSQGLRQARGFYVVLVSSMLGGVVVGFVGLDPIRALYYAAILNGLAAPPLIILMWLLARDHSVCGRNRSGRVSTAIVAITVVVSVLLPASYVVSSVLG